MRLARLLQALTLLGLAALLGLLLLWWRGQLSGGWPLLMLLALLLALRGTIFLYQGEELGLPQSTLTFEELRDPFGIAHWPHNPGRDGCRTPFPWQADAPQHGFTTAADPWLPADPAHAALAVDRQLVDHGSTLHATRRLLALRRERAACCPTR